MYWVVEFLEDSKYPTAVGKNNLCLFFKMDLVLGSNNYIGVFHLRESPAEQFCSVRVLLEQAGHPATMSPTTKCHFSPQVIMKTKNRPTNFQNLSGGQRVPLLPGAISASVWPGPQLYPGGGSVASEDVKCTTKHRAQSRCKVNIRSLTSGRKWKMLTRAIRASRCTVWCI